MGNTKGSHSGLNERTPNSNLKPQEEIKSTSKSNYKVNIKFSLNIFLLLSLLFSYLI